MVVILKGLNRIQVFLFDFFNNVTGAVLAMILLTVLAGIVSRYVFNRPFMWTEELATVLLVYLAFCSAPMATISKEHIVADFFKNMLPQRYERALSIIIRLVTIVFFVSLAISSINFIQGRTFRTAVLRIPRHVFYIPVLVGTLSMSFSTIVHMLNDFFPGYDYFMKRKEALEEANKQKEKEEAQAQVARMEKFLKSSKAQKETYHES